MPEVAPTVNSDQIDCSGNLFKSASIISVLGLGDGIVLCMLQRSKVSYSHVCDPVRVMVILSNTVISGANYHM